jgi:glycosyltransferase involved in cell wall biosynthesis
MKNYREKNGTYNKNMAKIKVLALETHYGSKGMERTHGVDFARIVNPMRALAKHPDFEVSIRKDPTEGYDQQSWKDLTEYFDVIYTSYIDSAPGYIHLGFWSRQSKKPYISDLDDNLWEVPKASPVYQHYHYGTEAMHIVSCNLQDTPYVTTTNLFLKYRLMKYLGKQAREIQVLPNFLDLNLYDFEKVKPKKKVDDRILIGFYGTNTHVVDMFDPGFQRAMSRILKEFPNVYFKTVGFMLPQMKTWYKKQYLFQNGEPDFDKWLTVWGEFMGECDIVVAPLIQTDFNRCKSGIKYLEYSAAKKPGVYQDIRQYQELVGVTNARGFLAGSEASWYAHLKRLIESEELRKQVGEAAYTFVKEKQSMEGNVEVYADYIKWVIADFAKTGGYSNLKEAGFILPEGGVLPL